MYLRAKNRWQCVCVSHIVCMGMGMPPYSKRSKSKRACMREREKKGEII